MGFSLKIRLPMIFRPRASSNSQTVKSHCIIPKLAYFYNR